ncbi:MAG TPA: M48 family metalloprotease [Novosphingobium sp.]
MFRSACLMLAAASLALAGCADEPPTPAVSPDDKAQAAEQHQELLAEMGGAYRGEEAAYVAEVGERLARAAGIGGQCTFTVVNTDVVNAFAVPGCYIYVTRGLLGWVNSEGELASVLGHELGHIVGNHSHEQMKRSLLRSLGVLAVGAITGSDQLTRIAGQAAGFFDLRYSRTHEYEADDLGLLYLRKAGYDPYAASQMLTALDRSSTFQAGARGAQDAQRIPEWQLTHPLTANRIARARREAEKTGLKPDALPEFEARYLGHLDGLLYGDDPEQGFVLGRRFAHPVMRIAFEAPEGFTLTNSPQAVVIDGPQGTQGEFAGGPLPPGGLEPYAEALLGQIVGQAPVEVVSSVAGQTNGLPSAVVQAVAQAEGGPATISLAVYDGGDGSAYHFVLVSRPGAGAPAGARDLFRSFHRLGAADVATLKPRFIRIRAVQPGEDARGLAARMAADRPAELFRLLNGLDANARLRVGQSVKLVTR